MTGRRPGLARDLPQARVVEVFNSIYYKHLASLPRPAGAPGRSAETIRAALSAARRSPMIAKDFARESE